MGAQTGMTNPIVFTGSDPAKVQQVIDIIPNPDTAAGSTRGKSAGFPGLMMDEMSPTTAAQLLVILTALKASVT